MYFVPITKRTIKLQTSLGEKVGDLKERMRKELGRDGQYVPDLDDFCLVPMVGFFFFFFFFFFSPSFFIKKYSFNNNYEFCTDSCRK